MIEYEVRNRIGRVISTSDHPDLARRAAEIMARRDNSPMTVEAVTRWEERHVLHHIEPEARS